MIEINEGTLGLHLSNLMRAKLGKHLDWSVPDIQNHVGPYSLDVFHKHQEKRQKIITICQNELAAFSNHEISLLLDSEIDDPESVRKKWKACQDQEIYKLGRNMPPWFAAGFGNPDYVADFGYWSQMPHFSHSEALLLSLGVEPKSFTNEHFLTFSTAMEKGNNIWPSIKYMLRRREQIERQFPTAAYYNRIEAKKLFDWFEFIQLEVHPSFGSRYLGANVEVNPAAEPLASKRPHQREIDSVCQLFTAMAIDSLGYDPTASRSPVPKEIGELAADLGIEISDDTVRKYLKQGAKFISSDWKPK